MNVRAFNGSPRMKKGVTGTLVRPMGQTMEMLRGDKPEEVKAIFDAFPRAGVEAVTRGRISDELQDAVAAPLISFEEFVARSNALFKQLIAENIK